MAGKESYVAEEAEEYVRKVEVGWLRKLFKLRNSHGTECGCKNCQLAEQRRVDALNDKINTELERLNPANRWSTDTVIDDGEAPGT